MKVSFGQSIHHIFEINLYRELGRNSKLLSNTSSSFWLHFLSILGGVHFQSLSKSIYKISYLNVI